MTTISTGHEGPFSETLPETQTLLLPTGRTVINPDAANITNITKQSHAETSSTNNTNNILPATEPTTITEPAPQPQPQPDLAIATALSGEDERTEQDQKQSERKKRVHSSQAWSEQDRQRRVYGQMLAGERGRAMEFTEVLQGI